MQNLPTKKQLRAYFLVEVMGETQVEAAKIMGVTRQTISRRLLQISKLRTKKQLRAYFLVGVMGETHEEAARLMGISRSAVSQLLKRFYGNECPQHKGEGTGTISLPDDFDDHFKDIF